MASDPASPIAVCLLCGHLDDRPHAEWCDVGRLVAALARLRSERDALHRSLAEAERREAARREGKSDD